MAVGVAIQGTYHHYSSFVGESLDKNFVNPPLKSPPSLQMIQSR